MTSVSKILKIENFDYLVKFNRSELTEEFLGLPNFLRQYF